LLERLGSVTGERYPATFGQPIYLEVDGGVKPGIAAKVKQAGADVLVAGSAVFDGGQPERKARQLLEAARSAELAAAH